MHIGPNGELRPDDPGAAAVLAAKILTGEAEEVYAERDPDTGEFILPDEDIFGEKAELGAEAADRQNGTSH